MAEDIDAPTKKPGALRDVSGTTLALTSLAVMSVAAVVSAPMWFWYRRKRRRTDALVAQAPTDLPATEATETPDTATSEPAAVEPAPGSGDAATPGPDGRTS